MQPLDLVFACVLPLAAGCGVLLLCGIAPRIDRTAWPAWALMAGFLVTGGLLWAALAFELPLEPGWMRATLAVIALGAGAAGVVRIRRAPRGPSEVPAPAPAARAAMAFWCVLAFAVVTVSVVLAMAEPVMRNDEAINWAAKGKQLWVAGGFNEQLAGELAFSAKMPPARAWHPDYPNLVPLVHLWSYVNARGIVHFDGRVPILLFRYALVLALAGALLRRFPNPLAGALLVPAVWMLCRKDLGADVIVAFGFLATLDALSTFLESRDRRWWRLAALAAMFLAASKHDGKIMLLATALGAAPFWAASKDRPRPGAGWLWLAAPAAALLSTAWFNWRFGLEGAVLSSRSDGLSFLGRLWERLPERAPDLLSRTWRAMAGSGLDSRVLHLAFLVFVMLPPWLALRRRVAPLTATLLLNWGGVLLVFAGTPYDYEWFANVALVRVMDQWTPALALWLAGYARELAGERGPAVPGRGVPRRVLAALLAAAVALASAGPLADLWNSRLPSRLRELGAVGTSEGARLERFLGPTWTFYRSVVERSPPEVPVVFVLPLSPAALLVWDQFSSLLFPKAVVPFVPEGRFIPPDFFGKYEIKYDNTVDGVLALTGPDFDVVLVPGEKPPDGIAIAEVLHETQWFVLARGADVRGATTRPR